MNLLKSCLNCGGKADFVYDKKEVGVKCSECGESMFLDKTTQKFILVTEWNKKNDLRRR